MKFEHAEEVVLVLENECAFYYRYTSSKYSTYGARRGLISTWLYSRPERFPSGVHAWRAAEHDQLRRYFDHRWEIPQTEENKYGDQPTIFPHLIEWEAKLMNKTVKQIVDKIDEFVSAPPVHVPQCPIPIPSPQYLAEWRATQEPATMIKITTQTLLNGTDIAKMSDEQLFDAIKEAEAEIKRLDSIESKPKKLTAKIGELRAGIAKLVEYMDDNTKA